MRNSEHQEPVWPGGENIEWKGAVEEGKVAFLKQRLTTQLAEAVGAFELQADEKLRFARTSAATQNRPCVATSKPAMRAA